MQKRINMSNLLFASVRVAAKVTRSKSSSTRVAVNEARYSLTKKVAFALPRSLIRRNFFSTPLALEQHTMNVPSMGDSITEGTMVEWLKDVGDYAAEDEVIAIVETDKVSVDIRAPVSGTVVEILAALDTNVEVGQELVRFDTDGEAPADVAAPNTGAPESSPEPQQEEKVAVVSSESTAKPAVESSVSHGRTPSIRFRHGKRNVIDEMLGFGKGNAQVQFNYTKEDLYFKLEHPDFTVKPKPMSEKEMEMINSGGADDSWDVLPGNATVILRK